MENYYWRYCYVKSSVLGFVKWATMKQMKVLYFIFKHQAMKQSLFLSQVVIGMKGPLRV